MRRTVVLALVLAMWAAACGGGDGGGLSEDAQAISDAIYAQITADASEDNPFGDTEARCFSDGVARDFGAAGLIEIGLSVDAIEAGTEPGDVALTDEQADTMATLMTECVDFRAFFIEEFAGDGVSEGSATCLADGFDDEFVQALAKSALLEDGSDPTEDPEQAETFFQLVTDCLTFDELQNLGG